MSSVEEERRLALERLRAMQQFYERPEAAQIMQQLQSRASGADQPFTPGVQGAQLAANADASAGQFRNEREGINRAFGNAGLSGSGLQASATFNAQRRANAMARQGRQQITSRAALANFQARENAQAQVQSYLAQMNQAQMQAGQAEVDFRSQAREVTQEPVQPQMGQSQGMAPPAQRGAFVPNSKIFLPSNATAPGGSPFWSNNAADFNTATRQAYQQNAAQAAMMKMFGV